MTSIAIAPSTRQMKGKQRQNRHQVPALQQGMAMRRRCTNRQRRGVIVDVNCRTFRAGRPQAWGSGRERIRMGFLVDRDRFEAIIAGAAEPEERRPARTTFNPVGSRNQLAALRAGISTGQIAGIESSHRRISLRTFVLIFVVD